MARRNTRYVVRTNPTDRALVKRFDRCVEDVDAGGYANRPGAVCVATMGRKYGKKRVVKALATARHRAAVRRHRSRKNPRTYVEPYRNVAASKEADLTRLIKKYPYQSLAVAGLIGGIIGCMLCRGCPPIRANSAVRIP